MVLAWYLDDTAPNKRLPCHRNPPEFVDMEELKKLKVLLYKMDTQNYEDDLKKIKEEQGYDYMDEITIDLEKIPDSAEKVKSFLEEHMHTEDEVRFVLNGSGYFDVRDLEDNWIRIQVEGGDLLIEPAGIYHRFTLDTNGYIKAIRLFQGKPNWTPILRPADDNPSRVEYLRACRRAMV